MMSLGWIKGGNISIIIMNIISNIQWWTRAINNVNVRGGVIMESAKHARQIWRERTSDDVGFFVFFLLWGNFESNFKFVSTIRCGR
jgi:RPA family protein